MGSHGTTSAPAGSPGSPETATRDPGPPTDLSRLTQAERAERALAAPRRARTVSIERALLEAGLDVGQTLRVLVSAIVPGFADWCFIDLVDRDGIPRRVEVAHADPALAALAREVRSVQPGPGWATPAAQAIRDRSPRLLRDLNEDLLHWATYDQQHLSVLRAIRPRSLAAVPLVARGRALGAVTVIRSAMTPGLAEDDLLALWEVVTPAALALDAAGRLEAERAARAAAEEEARRERAAREAADRAVLRLRRIESVSATLAAPLPPAALAGVAVKNGLATLGFSSALVVRQDPAGALEVLFALDGAGGRGPRADRLDADDPALAAEAFRIQTALWIPSPAALEEAYPSAWALRSPGEQAWAAAPLRVDGRTLGAIGLGFPHPRTLDEDERRTLLTLAQQLAQALERARLRELEAALGRR
jgi:GAF domain-containing protein